MCHYKNVQLVRFLAWCQHRKYCNSHHKESANTMLANYLSGCYNISDVRMNISGINFKPCINCVFQNICIWSGAVIYACTYKILIFLYNVYVNSSGYNIWSGRIGVNRNYKYIPCAWNAESIIWSSPLKISTGGRVITCMLLWGMLLLIHAITTMTV